MSILLILMTFGGLGVAFVLLMVSLYMKWAWLRKFVFGGIGIWFVFYSVLLLGSSFFSEEKTLSLNEPKRFCGFYLDCHMHTAVSGVRRTKKLGEREAKGEFYVVRVRVFSDAKGAKLGLKSVDARVFDENKNVFERDLSAEKELGAQTPFDQRITPAESFEKEIVFDLPTDVKNPRLDIREGVPVERALEAVLIGDEDSILHRRNFFKLETTSPFAVLK